ncbi:hypothetical protein H8959_007531 [Pygathrix nigripes]
MTATDCGLTLVCPDPGSLLIASGNSRTPREVPCSSESRFGNMLNESPPVSADNINLYVSCEIDVFIQEIEHALGLGPAKQCPLREFLTVYIKNIFLNQVLAEINKEIEGVTKTSDPLKILANADTMKVLGVQRPLLQSTIIVEKTVQDLLNLMHDLSAYSDQFLNMVCVKLQEYKDTCTAAYRGIVQSEEKLVISASWAKDDDISRLLKSLPNWMNMAQPKQLRPKREEEEDFIRAAFGKESEVLIGNLGDKLIPPQDILRDVSDLKALANMHESLEWLASRTKSAFSNLSTSQSMTWATTGYTPDQSNQSREEERLLQQSDLNKTSERTDLVAKQNHAFQ